MFTPIPEDESLSKRVIDESKGQIKDLLQKKIDNGDLNIEDVLAAPEIEE